MNKPIYHIFFWTSIYLLWIAVFHRYSVALSRTMTIEFCYLLFITADYYLINDFIISRYLHKKKYGLFVLSIVLAIAISAGLRALVAREMNLHFFHTVAISGFREIYINSLLNIALWTLLILSGKMLIERMQTHLQIEKLEKERIKTELDFLKAQINPHALFNSLNTIYGHIDKHNHEARNVLLQFSELLRYQLYDCVSDKVPLESEIEYIRNYTAFQRLRKDNRLIVDLRIESIEPGLQIAPLLLVVLIENAFKFVSDFSDQENKICMRLSIKNKILYGTFINTKEALQGNDSNLAKGIGLFNLKRRLELLYHGKYELKTTSERLLYKTHLNIDLS